MQKPLTLTLLLFSCDASAPVAGRAVVVEEAGRRLLAIDPDRRAVTVVDLATRETSEVEVGIDPSRIALLRGAAYVTLRGQRELVELIDSPGGFTVGQRFATGAEPIGVVIDRARGLAYVAASQADRIDVIDLEQGRSIAPIQVPGGPRGLALPASGRTLYVTTERHALLAIDLDTEVVRSISLRSPDPAYEARITGDPVVSPGDDRVSLPVLFVGTTTPLGGFDPGPSSYYTSMPGPGSTRIVPRFVATVVDVELDADGAPAAPPTSGATYAGVPAISSLHYDGDDLWIGVDGAQQVLRADADPVSRARGDALARFQLPTQGTDVTVGPSGEVFVTSDRARDVLRVEDPSAPAETLLPGFPSELVGEAKLLAEREASPLGREVLRGRALFYDARPGVVSNGGVSCASCHAEGRTDGTTWIQADGSLRQTPTLAERVTELAPLRWRGDRTSVADDVEKTVAVMGGQPISAEDARAVEAYVASIRSVDLPLKGSAIPELERGRAAFSLAGCASCHSGALFTDRAARSLKDRPSARTPSLLGVAATAPYLQDGSARDLEAILDSAETLEHGRVAKLGPSDRAALLMYLRSI